MLVDRQAKGHRSTNARLPRHIGLRAEANAADEARDMRLRAGARHRPADRRGAGRKSAPADGSSEWLPACDGAAGLGCCRTRLSRRWRRLEKSGRSEGHTSALQSLIRISYAVLCLKKKNRTAVHNTT